MITYHYCSNLITKNSYKSEPLARLGKSDHIMVRMIPVYKSKLKSLPVERKTVKVWNKESSERLKGCFEYTEWDVL